MGMHERGRREKKGEHSRSRVEKKPSSSGRKEQNKENNKGAEGNGFRTWIFKNSSLLISPTGVSQEQGHNDEHDKESGGGLTDLE